MPITEQEQDYAWLKAHQSPAYVCGDCGGNLTLAFGGTWGIDSYVLRCAKDWHHNGIAKPRVPTAEEAGLPYANPKRDKRRRQELETRIGTANTQALEKYQNRQTLTSSEAKFILRTEWPAAPDVEILKAAMVCAKYGLNPLMKHLFLVKYVSQKTGRVTWTRIMGIKAARLLASRRGRYSYLADTPRVMTEAEQVKIFGEADTSNICAITILKDEHGNTAQGYGFWPTKVTPKGTEKGNSKFNMACIRSERQAFDRLFPDCLPENVEVMDETFVEVGVADTTTGEITEAVTEPTGEQEGIEGEVKTPRDPASIGTILALQKAAHEDFGLQPKDQLEKLGLKAWTGLDITPAAAYQKLAALALAQ